MWLSLKKMTQVGGHFPSFMTLHHLRKCSFMCSVCIVESCTPARMGSLSLPGGGTGMFLSVNTSRTSWDSNSENKRMASWEKKSFPPTQCQDLLPSSASILLYSSGIVLRSGCAVGMQETSGHQLPKTTELLLLSTIAEKLCPLWGSGPPSPQENSDIVPLHGRIKRLNSCVTNFNTRGGCSKLKALLSEERAGRQHFNENYKQPLCA